MNNIDKALETQIANIKIRAGKSLPELHALLKKSGLAKHGELRDYLKRELGMGHGDANTVVHLYFQSGAPGNVASQSQVSGDPIDIFYAGKKAHLRPIHEKLMSEIQKFGTFELSPKKSYVSLRRKKQFAMIGPATQTRVEIGLNVKGLTPTDRLTAMPAGGMCQYKINITHIDEIDSNVISWIRQAYESAG